jgi:hypothetical protein
MMPKKSLFIALLLVCVTISRGLAGPYAPPAGQPGSTAVGMDDPNIIAWADGWENYVIGDECDQQWQTPQKALGQAQGTSFEIVCLGRGGEITLTFECGIGDGDGYDFAVFENSINDTFLELAYVEVSSNGTDFFRFECDSLTPEAVGGFGTIDATDITGLAGKYRQGCGTPFDLADLRDVSPLLNVDNVKCVRIIDIIGDGSCYDSLGKIIYDPYPTIGSAGFDLDAIGVMNTRTADLDKNGWVDTFDLMILMQAWLSRPGDGNWDSRCDISSPKDNLVNLQDFAVFSGQWLE